MAAAFPGRRPELAADQPACVLYTSAAPQTMGIVNSQRTRQRVRNPSSWGTSMPRTGSRPCIALHDRYVTSRRRCWRAQASPIDPHRAGEMLNVIRRMSRSVRIPALLRFVAASSVGRPEHAAPYAGRGEYCGSDLDLVRDRLFWRPRAADLRRHRSADDAGSSMIFAAR
jgi:hypothetical protein